MNRNNTASTVELLGLFILMTAMITVITGVFVMSRAHSLQARQLTEAVILADSAAETASAAPDNASLQSKLGSMANSVGQSAVSLEKGGDGGGSFAILAAIDPDDPQADKSVYVITVTRTYPDGTRESRADDCEYAEDTVNVYAQDDPSSTDLENLSSEELGEPVYTLVSGTYFGHDDQEGGRP